MARDYFHFTTKFFEPINVSAMHIYHSALELSPLSSIVRRLYYHRRHASSPRVIVGNQDSWDQQLVTSCKHDHNLCAWSPCGRFIAVGDTDSVEIRDLLSFELLSTLMPTEPGQELMQRLAYSMDGRSIASTLGTLLVIWDIQTGGVAKEIEHGSAYNVALVWSSNGSTIGIISRRSYTYDCTVCIYNVTAGTIHSPGTLPSADGPYLWAYDTSFRAMTTAWCGGGLIINVFEVGPVLTKIESFHIRFQERGFEVETFSQTTHRISINSRCDYFVFDIRTSRRLLSGEYLGSHCFSSDGSLFAGVSNSAVRIWKYTSDGYTLWREFPVQSPTSFLLYRPIQFSPTSSSLLVHSEKILRLCRLDGPPVVAHPGRLIQPFITLSRYGSYIATGHLMDSIVTITNLFSQTPPHSIDTGMWIYGLALTGNVLLVWDLRTIAAWRLTEDGSVDVAFVDRRAGRGDSIWTVSIYGDLEFSLGDQTVAIRQNGKVVHVYCTETGEVLEPTQTPLYDHNHSPEDMLRGLHLPYYRDIDPASIVQTGWMKDPEGKYQLWIPVEWRDSPRKVALSYDRKTMRLDLIERGTIFTKY